jgi:hypothetical protein
VSFPSGFGAVVALIVLIASLVLFVVVAFAGVQVTHFREIVLVLIAALAVARLT